MLRRRDRAGDPEEELLKLNLCQCFLIDFIYRVDAQHELIKPRAELRKIHQATWAATFRVLLVRQIDISWVRMRSPKGFPRSAEESSAA
jgi:hypothetical protein